MCCRGSRDQSDILATSSRNEVVLCLHEFRVFLLDASHREFCAVTLSDMTASVVVGSSGVGANNLGVSISVADLQVTCQGGGCCCEGADALSRRVHLAFCVFWMCAGCGRGRVTRACVRQLSMRSCACGGGVRSGWGGGGSGHCWWLYCGADPLALLVGGWVVMVAVGRWMISAQTLRCPCHWLETVPAVPPPSLGPFFRYD